MPYASPSGGLECIPRRKRTPSTTIKKKARTGQLHSPLPQASPRAFIGGSSPLDESAVDDTEGAGPSGGVREAKPEVDLADMTPRPNSMTASPLDVSPAPPTSGDGVATAVDVEALAESLRRTDMSDEQDSHRSSEDSGTTATGTVTTHGGEAAIQDQDSDSARRRKSSSSVASIAPSLTSSHPTASTSSASVASLVSADGADGGLSTPATSVLDHLDLAAQGLDRDDAVARYKEGLYAYTRALYLEAQLSVKKEEGNRGRSGSIQFGTKQSGMEKLAAKKALARHLNA